ncbi:MAG: DUF1778 domain-containing protein [Actinobacteria bacterium]|nr:DUF1778 domain-containing protein [Actinomycetota bacterium]
MAVTSRLEVRVHPDSKARLERAAALAQVPVSDFVRSAVEERTARVLAEYELQTLVPADFFDDLLASLDSPAEPNPALARALGRAPNPPRR